MSIADDEAEKAYLTRYWNCFWNQAEPEMRADYLRDARIMLEIARKAANE